MKWHPDRQAPEKREEVGLSKVDGQGPELNMATVYGAVSTIWLFNIAMERSTMLLIGKPSINGSFPMAMLNNQIVQETVG